MSYKLTKRQDTSYHLLLCLFWWCLANLGGKWEFRIQGINKVHLGLEESSVPPHLDAGFSLPVKLVMKHTDTSWSEPEVLHGTINVGSSNVGQPDLGKGRDRGWVVISSHDVLVLPLRCCRGGLSVLGQTLPHLTPDLPVLPGPVGKDVFLGEAVREPALRLPEEGVSAAEAAL